MLEKGLSSNSVIAYSRDVEKLVQYLAIAELDFSPQTIRRQDLQTFLAYLYDLGLAAASQARLISGLKAFFNFLVLRMNFSYHPSIHLLVF